MPSSSSHPVVNAISNSNQTKVKVAITDVDGVLRGKYMHKDKFLASVNSGFGFCDVVFGWDCGDVCYDNVALTGWHTGYPDAQVFLDLETHRKIPWENGISFFLGSVSDKEGKPLPVCPRNLLKKITKEAQNLGFHPILGFEFEWFNFNETPKTLVQKNFTALEPLSPGMFGYSVLRSSQRKKYFNDIMDFMEEFHVPLEGLHTETGPGVFEAAIVKADALEAADRAVLFKSGVKEIAFQHEITASFMARWNAKLPGCSGHMHQSLLNEDKTQNIFYEEGQEHKLSQTCKHYLAGQLAALPEILPMLAPNINSYKRLVEGFWAPTRSNWSIDNRTTAFRIINDKAASTRIEVRASGADINPYLAAAATLGAGLWGIKNKIPLNAQPIIGNGYKDKDNRPLPSNLKNAADTMEKSSIAKEIFGEVFTQHFADTRKWEWEQHMQGVTDWELKRYFEII